MTNDECVAYLRRATDLPAWVFDYAMLTEAFASLFNDADELTVFHIKACACVPWLLFEGIEASFNNLTMTGLRTGKRVGPFFNTSDWLLGLHKLRPEQFS